MDAAKNRLWPETKEDFPDVFGEIMKCNHHWTLEKDREEANDTEHMEGKNDPKQGQQPITCFLYPGLTPSKLRDHLMSQCASDACILSWMRKLQEFRHLHSTIPREENSYGVELLGK